MGVLKTAVTRERGGCVGGDQGSVAAAAPSPPLELQELFPAPEMGAPPDLGQLTQNQKQIPPRSPACEVREPCSHILPDTAHEPELHLRALQPAPAPALLCLPWTLLLGSPSQPWISLWQGWF